MKRIILRIVTVIGVLIITLLLMMVCGVALLNTDAIQNKLLKRTTRMLSEKLNTKVDIDSIHIGLFEDDIRLFGLEIEDLQHQKMLQVGQVGVEVRLFDLLRREVNIDEITVRGVKVNIYQSGPDSTANYQFVLEAFKKEKTDSTAEAEEQQKKATLAVDLRRLQMDEVEVRYNDHRFSFGQLLYKKGLLGGKEGTLRDVQTSWVHVKKKDSTRVDNVLTVDAIRYEEKDNSHLVAIDSLRWKTDNHLPHKREGKPKRGWFDDGHLDVLARLECTVSHLGKDSICGSLKTCEANDLTSGFHITDLHCLFKHQDGHVLLRDATVSMQNTTLAFPKGEIQLPSKKKSIPLRFSISDISGTVLLTDISRPFAPVLKDFKMPLWLSTKFSGSDSNFVFKDVVVRTPDHKLDIKASGGIEGLKDKYQLNVHFDVQQAVIKGNSKERIISQFPVKKFMMKQLHALGTLHYTGSFGVKWKKEEFRGRLGTACGHLQFYFALDELHKYLTGNVKSQGFELGKAMDYPDLGKTTCSAGFRFDISKPRTAQMRRQKGGKLPIGKVDALIDETKLKGVKFTNVAAHIVSDGAVAEGEINMKGKLADILCSFSFTNTDEMRKTKIKPGIRFHLFEKKNKKDKSK
ncbi:MAG: AsmA family protein [Prevotella sp.]|nr:AsmA family protein [Prevotella sp.]